ncbi:MAG: hypothetical protein ACP5LM_01545 [Thermoplasmata archaeon]
MKTGKGAYYLFIKDYYKNIIFLYFLYSFSSLVSLSTFISFILIPDLIYVNYISIIPFLLILIIIFVLIKINLKLSIKISAIGAFLEVLFILSISLILLKNINMEFSYFEIHSLDNIFLGGIFSVLVFAGLGSPISYGDLIKNPENNLKKIIVDFNFNRRICFYNFFIHSWYVFI